MAKKAAEKMEATCSKGCNHCCHLLTIVTLPEAIAIAEKLLNDPKWGLQITQLMQTFMMQAARLEDPNITRESYFQQKVPCAFLGAEGQCRVYDVRPTACRYHYVVSDPKNCSHEVPVGTTVAQIDLRALEMKVWQEGQHASSQLKIPLVAAPLQVSMLWALRILSQGKEALAEAMADTTVTGFSYWMSLLVSDTPFAQILEEAKRRVSRAQETF